MSALKKVHITIDGRETIVSEGTTVAAAVLNADAANFRRSVDGEPRLPLCGMGVCYECRLTIDGQTNQKSCQIVVVDGMEITTDG